MGEDNGKVKYYCADENGIYCGLTELPNDTVSIDGQDDMDEYVIEIKLDELVRSIAKDSYTPRGIYHNRKTDETIVLWTDGTKTVVKKMADKDHSPYEAFTAALAKKIFGSNTQVNKIVEMTTEPRRKQKPKKDHRILDDEFFKCFMADLGKQEKHEAD